MVTDAKIIHYCKYIDACHGISQQGTFGTVVVSNWEDVSEAISGIIIITVISSFLFRMSQCLQVYDFFDDVMHWLAQQCMDMNVSLSLYLYVLQNVTPCSKRLIGYI